MSHIITKAWIESGMSDTGGYNRDQLALIGVAWPPLEGWKQRSVGKQIPMKDAERFILLRGLKKKQRRFLDVHNLDVQLDLAVKRDAS